MAARAGAGVRPAGVPRDRDLFGDLVEDERFTEDTRGARLAARAGARATLETWEQSTSARCWACGCPATAPSRRCTARSRTGPRPGAAGDEGVVDLRQRHPRDLPGAPRPRAGGLPGRDRRPRAVRPGGRGRPGLQAVGRGRPGRRLPHLRLRRLRRVPPRLPDRLHRPVAGGVRLAARRRPRGVPARRGEHLPPLPDSLSYVDGALVSCGFGTAYEALLRLGSPARTGSWSPVSGRSAWPRRCWRGRWGPHRSSAPTSRRSGAAGRGPRAGRRGGAGRRRAPRRGSQELTAAAASREVDCSATRPRPWRWTARATWGRCAFVGEGGEVGFDVSALMIHKQITLHGSWVTSIGHMEDLLRTSTAGSSSPRQIVTDRSGSTMPRRPTRWPTAAPRARS